MTKGKNVGSETQTEKWHVVNSGERLTRLFPKSILQNKHVYTTWKSYLALSKDYFKDFNTEIQFPFISTDTYYRGPVARHLRVENQ